jgi:hypothetical protein
MKFVEHYKGFDIYSEIQSGEETFIVCMDTPDGMIRCKQKFISHPTVRECIEHGLFLK